MGRRPHPRNAAGQKSSYPRLYGRHAVFAALDNPERVHRKLYVTHETAKEIVIPKGLTVQYGDSYDLARLIPNDAPHQGYVLEVEPLENPWIGDIFALGEGNRRPLLVLDQVTDPHNVGAILRSAAAFNALALVTQDRHAPTESGVLPRPLRARSKPCRGAGWSIWRARSMRWPKPATGESASTGAAK